MRRLCAGAIFRPGKRRDAALEGPVRGSGLSPVLEQAAVSVRSRAQRQHGPAPRIAPQPCCASCPRLAGRCAASC